MPIWYFAEGKKNARTSGKLNEEKNNGILYVIFTELIVI